MRHRAHTHPCQHCGTPVECDGTLERNVDGWPEVVCDGYHLSSGQLAQVLCEDCEEKLCPVCQTKERTMSEYGIRYRRCDDCEDGGEPDYDAVTLQELYQRASEQKYRLR